MARVDNRKLPRLLPSSELTLSFFDDQNTTTNTNVDLVRQNVINVVVGPPNWIPRSPGVKLAHIILLVGRSRIPKLHNIVHCLY